MANENVQVYPRVILGLDISTACIGCSIVKDFGDGSRPEIIALTHKSPKVPTKTKGIEALFLRKRIFKEEFLEHIEEYTDEKITDVVIEEPLLSSNNAYTVASLLRYNGMIADAVYETLGIVPDFISSYDARTFSFPQLVAIRKYNKKGVEYSHSHIKDAIKHDKIVLFGEYPFDIDKKVVMMNMVDEMYPGIEWIRNKKGELKKENYDACDSLICVLAYININHNGIAEPQIVCCDTKETNDEMVISYVTRIWDKTYSKILTLSK